ncbi:Hydantoinase/oxoprolinase [Corchorus capsularis]|uniref:Hydantoinase/oxoprolinase n=1 Tax=Corchorus capsularis TaxID=210143 RepID=A0A1R3I3H9_COCAP|nr:Hydantoinase/oxoprolinase [Corchorus capsularis]
MSKKKSSAAATAESDEVDQLLQAAQDEMLLKLSVDSHMSRVAPDYLDPDLSRRFQALRSRPSTSQSKLQQRKQSSAAQPPPQQQEENKEKEKKEERESKVVVDEELRGMLDRGGTFTDVYAEIPGQPDGQVLKLLSVDPSNYDDAPIEGIRRILEEYTGEKIPWTAKIPTDKIEWSRMGTTLATNALLERKWERIALCVTRGFKDLLQIVDERIELVLEEEKGNAENSESVVKGFPSDGGLAPESRFSGHKAVLSGPAGGVVGYSHTLFGLETEKPLIGFDMGGTSTDVGRYAGSYEQVIETKIAGAILQAPQLDISNVAAGDGSKLKFQFGAFRVGPESEDQPLDINATKEEFKKLADQINSYRKSQDSSAKDMTVEEIALGFVNVANEIMCHPIRQLTEMKGHETRNHALACFGGAGPQHACAIARSLGMTEVLIYWFCGILSAYGMGLADVVEEAQEPYAAVYGPESVLEASRREAGLLKQVNQKLQEQGFREENIKTETYLNLRYEGTDTAIMVKRRIAEDGSTCGYADEFMKLFQQEYGFKLQNRNILVSMSEFVG